MRTMRIREDVKVVEEGKLTTKVLVLKTETPSGGIRWDIPTEALPARCRKLGTTFRLLSETYVPENDDDLSKVGKFPPKFTVEENA